MKVTSRPARIKNVPYEISTIEKSSFENVNYVYRDHSGFISPQLLEFRSEDWEIIAKVGHAYLAGLSASDPFTNVE